MLSSKLKQLQLLDGYKFRFQKTLANGVQRFLCCKSASQKCYAFLKFDVAGVIIEERLEHNHEPDDATNLTRQKIPGTSDTANDEFGSTADYSYSGGFDGSQFGSSVLQDSTNSVDESYDNTYDTSYNEACGPPSAKRKRPSKPAAQPEASRVGRNHSSSEENLSDNYQAFSELVVAQLKSLPPNRAAILQLKIQTLLSKAIVGSEEDEEGTEEEALGDEDSEMNIEATVKSDVEADTELGEKSPRRARSEDYPSRAETQVETTTTTTMVTTIAKKKSLRQDGATENKENQQVVLDNVYIAFSKCIVSQLKSLPAPVAMKTQNRIQKVISDEIVRFHNTRTSSGHTDTKAEDTPVNSPPAVQIKEEPEDSCED